MNVRKVVCCFLQHQGEILVRRRSGKVSTYRGRWAGGSGSIEDDATAFQQALRETNEEPGLTLEDTTLLRQGNPLVVEDAGLGVGWSTPFCFLSAMPIKCAWTGSMRSQNGLTPSNLVNWTLYPNSRRHGNRVLVIG